jgi:hypothetical protein
MWELCLRWRNKPSSSNMCAVGLHCIHRGGYKAMKYQGIGASHHLTSPPESHQKKSKVANVLCFENTTTSPYMPFFHSPWKQKQCLAYVFGDRRMLSNSNYRLRETLLSSRVDHCGDVNGVRLVAESFTSVDESYIYFFPSHSSCLISSHLLHNFKWLLVRIMCVSTRKTTVLSFHGILCLNVTSKASTHTYVLCRFWKAPRINRCLFCAQTQPQRGHEAALGSL